MLPVGHILITYLLTYLKQLNLFRRLITLYPWDKPNRYHRG